MRPLPICAGQLRRSIKKATKCLVEPNEAWTNDVVSVELRAEEWINIMSLLGSRPMDCADEKALKRNASFKYLDP